MGGRFPQHLPGPSIKIYKPAWPFALTSSLCFSWYKDGELLEYSHPNYVSLKGDHITIVANAINEGVYTCIVKKKDKVLTTYSWRVRVRF